jgi:ElaB/YqjD/DUF883 family membrane-anchored ribosome-binding protein
MEETNSLSENRALTRTAAPGSSDNKQNASNYAQDLKTQTQQYGQQALEGLNKAKDYATEYYGQAAEKLKDLQGKDLNQIADEAKDFARRKPAQAIAISAAIGLLLGLVLRGGRR